MIVYDTKNILTFLLYTGAGDGERGHGASILL